ncbi:MAG: phosphate/phosphite/phosphonate ABC transporter substrate-binding protein [Proteobacteria bacterium]|nr:phosphate/phosphite/phosphonate ABC transporter substrate-binding protein [Pseudomonadota bacterium]MBU1717238.1 phosphate/phosphite/phosphonate ABC transporter substrate-binding protein [Pseudomonadota bacterium]
MPRQAHAIMAAILFLFFVLTFSVVAAEINPHKNIRIGVASMVTPVSAVRYYHEIVDYVADQLEMPGEMVHRTTYDEIDRMLEDKSVDVAFICSAPYVIDKEKFGVELLVAPVINDDRFYQSDIIVHRDSQITTFEGLKNKNFAFVDPKSNSGRLYPAYWLAKKGLTPDTFFDRYFFSYSHNKSVEMVAKKKADGAAVDSVVLAYMLASGSPYATGVKVIHQSPQFGIPPVVVAPGLPLYLKEKLREIFLRMHENSKGRKILTAMRIDRFERVPDSNYDSIREMRSFIEQKVFAGSTTTEESGTIEKMLIKFGVIPWDNPRIAYEKYQPFLDYLGMKTGARFELALKSSYQDLVAALGNGEFYLALLGPLTYLDAHARFEAVPIAKSVTQDDAPFYQSVIVVGPESDITRVSQLVGRKFAFSSLWSTSGNLFPRYMLAWEDIHLDRLSLYENFNYHDTVVKKVLSGEYDAGAVRLTVAEKYAPYGLKIIDSSDPIPTGPVVVSPMAPYAVIRKVQETLLTMAADPEGRKILKNMEPELQGGFVPASDADYSGVRKMINDVPTTCGIGCHPKVHF